jgi:hypothetical protein
MLAIFNVRKVTIEMSRRKNSWKEDTGGEGFKAFREHYEPLDEKIWLNEISRPDPSFFN